MSEQIADPRIVRIICDAPKCLARHVFDPPLWSWEIAEVDMPKGWSRYVGRSRRDYCPDHEPTPGHTMRRIW